MVTHMSDFTCPKCSASMRSYERNGITIEQCTECRGVFLDRGELDHMIDSENRRYEEPARVPQPQTSYREEYRQPRYDDDYKHKKKKRHGFLSELFDD